MPHVDDDVQSEPRVRSHGLVHGGVEEGHERLDLPALTTRAEPDPGPVPRRGTALPNTSTPRFTHGLSNWSWIAAAMLDFTDLGVPFNTAICPASIGPLSTMATSQRFPTAGIDLVGGPRARMGRCPICRRRIASTGTWPRGGR